MAEAAGKLPEIHEAEILQGPKTINNTKGVQGDLMISLDKPPADASLTSDGGCCGRLRMAKKQSIAATEPTWCTTAPRIPNLAT